MLAVGKFLRCTLCRSGTGLEHAKKGCKGFLLTLEKKILSCISRNNVRLGSGLRWNVITGEEGVPYHGGIC